MPEVGCGLLTPLDRRRPDSEDDKGSCYWRTLFRVGFNFCL